MTATKFDPPAAATGVEDCQVLLVRKQSKQLQARWTHRPNRPANITILDVFPTLQPSNLMFDSTSK